MAYLDDYQKCAVEAIKAGGEILKKHKYSILNATIKEDGSLVTKIDKMSSDAIRNIIKKYFPNDGIIDEETPSKASSTDFTWIIDPLDGTTSYYKHNYISSVTLALVKNGEPIIGLVYDPFQDDLYYARKDSVAFVNDIPIEAIKPEHINIKRGERGPSLIFFYDTNDYFKDAIYEMSKNRKELDLVRYNSSIALQICMVAKGSYDALIFEARRGLGPWDLVAASLILEKSGGRLLDLNLNQLNPCNIQKLIYASNNKNLDKLISNLYKNNT